MAACESVVGVSSAVRLILSLLAGSCHHLVILASDVRFDRLSRPDRTVEATSSDTTFSRRALEPRVGQPVFLTSLPALLACPRWEARLACRDRNTSAFR
jgi:hypothetical protein